MRDQYAGDISDYLKFAFVRMVSRNDRRLGMAWYYLPGHDGRADGRHVEYWREEAWSTLDPGLFNRLSALPQRSVHGLENLDIWPEKTRFHRDPVGLPNRREWVGRMVAHLAEADFVFLDPDNGLGKHRAKHAHLNDLVSLRQAGRTLAIIKFPGRHKTHALQIADLHRQLRDAGFRNPMTVSTCVRIVGANRRPVPRHRFFTLVDGDAQARRQVTEYVGRLNALPPAARVSAVCIG